MDAKAVTGKGCKLFQNRFWKFQALPGGSGEKLSPETGDSVVIQQADLGATKLCVPAGNSTSICLFTKHVL